MDFAKYKPYLIKFLIAFSITAVICVIILVGVFIAAIMGVFGGVENLDIPALTSNASSQIYYVDEQGTEQLYVTLTAEQNKVWVDFENIPQDMKDAFVAIEDQRFYSHSGVDLGRTVKAFFSYLGNKITGKATSFGGSTITQQLVKNLTGDTEQTAARKIREISQAVNLEKQISKDKILELYMNSIYLSQGCTGVQAASHEFFGKPVNELTLAECASIAGITQYPTYYDPIINPENNKAKQEIVLKKMLQLKYITKEEYNEAIAQELVFGSSDDTEEDSDNINSYFVDHVITELTDNLTGKGYSETLATKMVYSGGLKIVTTIDPHVQETMEDVYENTANFPNHSGDKPVQSAMVVMEPRTGEIKGLIGGIGKKDGNLVLNRATQSRRQPGSTIKPIAVYAPAMEEGIINAADVYIDQAVNYNGWIPHNYSRTFTDRPVTVRYALRQSLNTVPVFVLDELGTTKSYNFLTQKLGITTLVQSETAANGKVLSDLGYSSLALGGLTHGISPLELTAAYTPFANEGLYSRPYSIKYVSDASGRIIVEDSPSYTNAMSEETAYVMSRMLNEVVTSGTGGGAGLPSGMYTAGKTGTTSDNHDRWFVGYTPHYVAAVWYGYDDPRPIVASGNPCIPVWRQVMTEINKDKVMITAPSVPSGITSASYCNESGLLATENCENKSAFWFDSDNLPKGKCRIDHLGEEDEGNEEEPSEEPEGDTNDGQNDEQNGEQSDTEPSNENSNPTSEPTSTPTESLPFSEPAA